MKLLKKVFIGLFCMIFIFSLVGCGKKKKISPETFKSKMEEKNVTINEPQNTDSEEVVKYLFARENDSMYSIEFYEFTNSKAAQTSFDELKSELMSLAVKGSVSSNFKSDTRSKYMLTNNDNYYVASVIDNTLLFAVSPVEYKNDLKKIIKELGY